MEGNKKSHIDKIVGNVDKKGVLSYLEKLGKNKLENELEKTERDQELIDFSQKSLDEYLLDYRKDGVYEVLNEKIHIVPAEGVFEFTDGWFKGGSASSLYGSCLVDRNSSDIIFSIRLFHEMFHLKSFTSIHVRDNNSSPVNRRSGFSIYNKKGEFFELVDETINDYFCKKFFEEKIKNSNLFDKEDIEKYNFDSPRFQLLEKFEEISEDLYQKNKNDFISKEDVKKLFIDGDINGNILPIARLIEKTYGKGSFRIAGKKY